MQPEKLKEGEGGDADDDAERHHRLFKLLNKEIKNKRGNRCEPQQMRWRDQRKKKISGTLSFSLVQCYFSPVAHLAPHKEQNPISSCLISSA